MISKVHHKILDLVMAKVEKVNIAVTYILIGLGNPMWLFHPVNSLVATRNLWLILLSKI
jgi:hypothetical protein